MSKNKPVEQKPEAAEAQEQKPVEQKPEAAEAQEQKPVEQKPVIEVKSKSQVKVETEMVKDEATGLIIPKTQVSVRQPYHAKKYDSDSWAVYSEAGELVKIYSEKDGTKPEDCERGAKNLANKLSNQFIEK